MMTLWSPERYTAAWNFASVAHKAQMVPGSEDVPYLNHIGNVTQEVLLAIAVEPVAKPDLSVQCAVLHDTIEDTAITYEKLVESFGAEVADGVSALTKYPAVGDKTAQMQDSLTRIRMMPPEVWLVKMADRISNLQEPPHYWSDEKINRYLQEAILILDALSDAHAYLAERLKLKIERYRQNFCRE